MCARCHAGGTPAHPPGAVPGAILPGAMLGKCAIVRELGRGGMGTVYLARHRTLDVPVAVKVLSPEVARVSPKAAERFLREARLTARIRHPNLVAVMDTDTDPVSGVSYLVMEFVDGPSAAALLVKGPLAPAEAVRVALGVARALEAAEHHHIVHRDIKPANVLIAADGTVKLTDLGLAKDMEFEGRLTNSQATLGTPLYMAPEQIKHGPVDARTDIYALGVTLFELLTTQPPYTGMSFYEIADYITQGPVPDPRDWQTELDPRLAELVIRMMAKAPEARPQTPGEVVALLSGWLGEPAGHAAVKVASLSGLRPGDPHVNVPTLTSVPPAAPAPRAVTRQERYVAKESAPAAPANTGRTVVLVCGLAVIVVAMLLIARPELFRLPGHLPPGVPPGWKKEWGPPPRPGYHPSGWQDGEPFPPGYENTTWRPGDPTPPPWDVDYARGTYRGAGSASPAPR